MHRRELGILLASAAAEFALGFTARTARAASRDELIKLLEQVDDQQRSEGDWKSLVHIEQKERDKVAVVYEALVLRRSKDQRFLILFTKPKVSQGQGYLRIDRNLWFYDPSIGKWERRTEREHIGGTNSRRSDFDESRLTQEYEPEDRGEEKLGVYQTQLMMLRGKPGLDLAFPVVKLWIDRLDKVILKRQDFALSGRLLRTSYFPKWKKIFNAAKQAEVWYPEEIRVYDEVDRENSTLIINRLVELKPLDNNVFTKAWLEGKSR